VNQAIEIELIEFKREIEEKFARSSVNREYFFPWKPVVVNEVFIDEELDSLEMNENI